MSGLQPSAEASSPVTPAPFRVVRCYFRLPPEPGGMETHVASLTAAQRARGIEVVNVFNVGQAAGPAVQIWPGRDLLHVNPAVLRNLVFYSGALAKRRQLRGGIPTIVHAHGDWSDFLLARQLARAIGASALAATVHDRISARKSWLYRRALAGFDPIFATGKADQIALQDMLGRTTHHLPSAPADLFFEPAGPYDIEHDVIGVTNFFAKKAPGLFIDIAARRPNLCFALFGDGPLREELLRRIADEGIDNVALPGRRPPAEVAAALRRSRLLLSTALREGTPTAALEAMACGLPVVLTPSNNYEWLIENGSNGFVTQGWSVDEIVARIDDILVDEANRLAMGIAARERARQHSWAANAATASQLMAQRLGVKWDKPCGA